MQIQKGDTRAMVALAQQYTRGAMGVPKDINMATLLLESSADAGNPLAALQFASMFQHGEGVIEKDLEKAVWYYIMSAASGCSQANFLTGSLELDRSNFSKGKELIQAAAAHGNSSAMEVMNQSIKTTMILSRSVSKIFWNQKLHISSSHEKPLLICRITYSVNYEDSELVRPRSHFRP